ncbi:Strongly-conserved Zn-finger binding protein (TFIIIA) [Tulasnella sp. 419]|nr:Strongly-conserved Zn-finger binding protein (TFIIIA) [Tulasnella sp. 419]
MSSGPVIVPRPHDVSSVLGKRKFAFVEVPKLTLPANSFSYILLSDPADSEDEDRDGISNDGTTSDEDFEDDESVRSLEDDLGGEIKAKLENVTISKSQLKRFKCSWEGCNKAYKKPARLAEHIRSHTGERPFKCQVCQKTYLRKSHLDAHSRTHASTSEKAFVCSFEGCGKRFWTSQDTRRHEKLHTCEKPYKCVHEGCEEAFAKHHQLRSHVAEVHAPAGTKPFRCDKEGCLKSFENGVKLRRHMRVHDPNRYFCSEIGCHGAPFFPTWTGLQAHIRSEHPPTCPYRQCNGRTFASRKNLKDHIKLHEQRKEEMALEHSLDSDVDHSIREESPDAQLTPQKKRRGGDMGRDWKCDLDECNKAFKSKNALKNHRKVAHDKRLDFSCRELGCSQTFGYKHVLQRHIQTCHSKAPLLNPRADEPPFVPEILPPEPEVAGPLVPIKPNVMPAATFSIDDITGKSYNDKATARAKKLVCPLTSAELGLDEDQKQVNCKHIFSRLYDLRRHLKAIHGVDMELSDLRDLMEPMDHLP